MRNGNEVFVEARNLLLLLFKNTRHDGSIETLREICNVLEIENNGMPQLFLIEMNRPGISVFCEIRVPAQEDPQRKCFRRFDHKLPDEGGFSVK